MVAVTGLCAHKTFSEQRQSDAKRRAVALIVTDRQFMAPCCPSEAEIPSCLTGTKLLIRDLCENPGFTFSTGLFSSLRQLYILMRLAAILLLTLTLSSCSESESEQAARADKFVRMAVIPALKSMNAESLDSVSCDEKGIKSITADSQDIQNYLETVGYMMDQEKILVASDFVEVLEPGYSYVATYKITGEFSTGRNSIGLGLLDLDSGWCLATLGRWSDV
mgnify:CR=1 FL=1